MKCVSYQQIPSHYVMLLRYLEEERGREEKLFLVSYLVKMENIMYHTHSLNLLFAF